MGIRLYHSAQFQPYYIDIDKGQSAGHVTATVLTVTIIRRYFIFIKLPQPQKRTSKNETKTL